MVSRRPAVATWMPARILAWPTVATGFWLMAGVVLAITGAGGGHFRIMVHVVNPNLWLRSLPGWLGAGLFVVGVILTVLASWRFRPDRWGVMLRYPLFSLAGHVLLLALVCSLWSGTGLTAQADHSGLTLRWVAATRSGARNHLASVAIGLACLACYLASIGRLPDLLDFAPEPEGPQPASAT